MKKILIPMFALMGFVGVKPCVASDPAKIVGSQACAACHPLESGVWNETHHAKAFDLLHRLPKAKEIADKMGVSKIKGEGDCMNCHYTAQKSGVSNKVVSGVSCESCHGEAKEWVAFHHQQPRQKEAESVGWVRGSNLYQLYSACYECHTVPNEKLVNTGGHAAGSPFELVSWSQGEIRHRFYDAKTNPESPLMKQRVLYLLGGALDLEHALRAVSKATVNDTYGQRMALRVKGAVEFLEKANAKVSLPNVKAILDAVPRKADGKLDLRLKNEVAYQTAADQVKAATQAFLAEQDGSKLGALDPLLPKIFMGSVKP